MDAGIFVVVPTAELAGLVTDAAQALDLSIVVEIAELQEALRLARRQASEGAEVVVARGGTARLLHDSFPDVPVVDIEVSTYDILHAVANARRYGRRIAVMGSSSLMYGLGELHGLVDADIVEVPAESDEEASRKWPEIVKAHIDCVVGDGLVCRLAEKRSFPAVPIRSGSNAVFAALRNAAQVIEIRRREGARADRVKTMIDSVQEAIVALDESRNIVMFNLAAETLFGLAAAEVIDRPMASVRSPGFQGLLAGIEGAEPGVRNINGSYVMAKWTPVFSSGIPSGEVITLQKASEIERMENKIRKELHTKGHVAKSTFEDIIGQSPATLAAVRMARKYAALDSTVLITGETGVGKESFAQAIHNASKRANRPFVAVNCGALPEDLLESELFGYVEGAFTGARKQGKTGLFELAHTGTIFLDEIGHVSPKVQLRLLRVLQEREVMRLGDDRIIPVDVRVVAATNADLAAEVQEGSMRADLFYRLNVLSLSIPPLRERQGDIVLLAEIFLARNAAVSGRHPLRLAPVALNVLSAHPFPGNIRELQNVIERAAALCEGHTVNESLIFEILGRPKPVSEPADIDTAGIASLKDIERDIVRGVLEKVNGSSSQAAAILGVSRTTVWRKRRGK